MKYYGRGLLLLLIVSLVACSREEIIPLPLTQDKLVDVLVDVHVAEAMIDKIGAVDQDTVGKVYYRMIFREHGITQQAFDESMSILREDPKRLNDLYEQILDTLNVREAGARGMPDMEN